MKQLTLDLHADAPPLLENFVAAANADLLAALSQDSQAKLTTDTTRRFVVGSGDGLETTFTTPFLEITSIKDVTPMPHNGCRPPKARRV